VFLRLECDVTYADAGWKMLFIQDSTGQGAYVPYGDNLFQFKAGQHIIAAGTIMPPNADISFEHATVTQHDSSQLVPISIAGKVVQFQQFINKYVTCEGLVDHYRRLDATHLQLTLSMEGETVLVWILLDPSDEVPALNNTNVRIEGVYNPKVGPDSKLSSLEILVSGLKHLTIVNRLENDPRFQTPVVPIEALSSLPPDRLVHIVGRVKEQEPGRYVRIRDDSGQIDVLTGQTTLCPIGAVIDAVGYPAVAGTEWRLRAGLFRSGKSETAEPAVQPNRTTLRLAQQVRELSAPQAMEGLSVWLSGVVTWSDANSPFFFIQDSSSGICIMRGQSNSAVRTPGRIV
jgi:hypothetical protein